MKTQKYKKTITLILLGLCIGWMSFASSISMTPDSEAPQTDLEKSLQLKLDKLYWFSETPKLEIARDYINPQKTEEFISDVLLRWNEIAPLLHPLELENFSISNHHAFYSNRLNIGIGSRCEGEIYQDCLTADGFIRLLKIANALKTKNETNIKLHGLAYHLSNSDLLLKAPEDQFQSVLQTLPLLVNLFPYNDITLSWFDKISKFTPNNLVSDTIFVDTTKDMKVIKALLEGKLNASEIEALFEVEKHYEDPSSHFYIDQAALEKEEALKATKYELENLYFPAHDISVSLKWINAEKTHYEISIQNAKIDKKIIVDQNILFPIRISTNGSDGFDGSEYTYFLDDRNGRDGSSGGDIVVHYDEGLLEKVVFSSKGGRGGKAGFYRRSGWFSSTIINGSPGRDARDGTITYIKNE